MKIETTIPRPGVVMQALTSPDIETRLGTIHGQYMARIVDVAAAQLDEAIRSQLIALGWTPPKNIVNNNTETLIEPPPSVESFVHISSTTDHPFVIARLRVTQPPGNKDPYKVKIERIYL